jgi:hypothetical protein
LAISVPTARAIPSNLDFRSQRVSTLGPPLVLTISNVGRAPLKISSVRVSSGAVDDFLISHDTCSGTTLPLDGACKIDVRFGPTASGVRSATLGIVSNDPLSPLQIALSGMGTSNAIPAPRGTRG